LIDGAHALGALDFSLKDLDADYYISNAHKWFCAPKGCAFLYVRRELQSRIEPLNISHGFGAGFLSNFAWTGLHDYGPWLALFSGLKFWEILTPKVIREYMSELLKKVILLLTTTWKTETLATEPEMIGTMALVRLPTQSGVKYTGKDADDVQNFLFFEHQIEVPIKCVQDQLYVRVSCHIYNELEEYELLAKALKDHFLPKDLQK
jgi:isopenicillin-N epimerase